MPDQVGSEVAESRRDELMTMQREIMDEHQQKFVGQTIPVLIDGRDPDTSSGQGGFVARTMSDAPEIDGVVRLPQGDLRSGDMIRARIVGAADYDLQGVVAPE
jgi:ribosomal protein S12 methylthiotransferase